MLQATSRFLQDQSLTSPTVIIDKTRAVANISRMAAKAQNADATFRPHFKTHQSGVVGRWFQAAGVRQITVSSLAMAAQFADLGWRDITVAVLHNPRATEQARQMAVQLHQQGGRLGLVVDDLSACDEIRPGNFVFNDLMQLQIGSCRATDLAAAVACPVIGVSVK